MMILQMRFGFLWLVCVALYSAMLYANDNESIPNYYDDIDKHTRLPYVDYSKLMASCMGKYPPREGTPAYFALQMVCNKQLDQVSHPEMFEGKIPGHDSQQGNIGQDIANKIWGNK